MNVNIDLSICMKDKPIRVSENQTEVRYWLYTEGHIKTLVHVESYTHIRIRNEIAEAGKAKSAAGSFVVDDEVIKQETKLAALAEIKTIHEK